MLALYYSGQVCMQVFYSKARASTSAIPSRYSRWRQITLRSKMFHSNWPPLRPLKLLNILHHFAYQFGAEKKPVCVASDILVIFFCLSISQSLSQSPALPTDDSGGTSAGDKQRANDQMGGGGVLWQSSINHLLMPVHWGSPSAPSLL